VVHRPFFKPLVTDLVNHRQAIFNLTNSVDVSRQLLSHLLEKVARYRPCDYQNAIVAPASDVPKRRVPTARPAAMDGRDKATVTALNDW
jgi:hypothetical protein